MERSRLGKPALSQNEDARLLPHEAFEHLPENASDKPFEAILVELKR